MFDSLPQELKQTPQWCVAGPDKVPRLYRENTWVHASPVQGPWHTFEEALEIATRDKGYIGFILTPNDPFVCIDIDIKDIESRKIDDSPYLPEQWTDEESLQAYNRILTTFDSYTELSISGKGCHIWLKGEPGKGLRRDGVEVYSQDRFIICTGKSVSKIEYSIDDHIVHPNVVNGLLPLQDRSEQLKLLIAEMSKDDYGDYELFECEQTLDDIDILEMAVNAENAEKFNDLCAGNWQKYNYPSQSEADLSLMSMIAFYSKSNEQCRRLFRMSELGKRDKAVRNDRYLNYTLRGIRARQANEEAMNDSAAESAKNMLDRYRDNLAKNTAKVQSFEPLNDDGLPYPPGMAGKIARFMFGSAMRPVKEVSIVATLGFLAGVCGKSYYIPQSGLNAYIILVARSAIGKEAMHSGISLLLQAIRESTPRVYEFVNFDEFASGAALTKGCLKNQSFVNVSGEWGRKLKRLAVSEVMDGPMQQLRTVMTNLYQKSGPQSVVGGLSYSDKGNNVASVSGVAYSMIGETTPGTLYDSLTETMMEDGFLSRFTIIEYRGDRPAANKNPVLQPDEHLTEAICLLVEQSLNLLNRSQNCEVKFSLEAKTILDEFDKLCDSQINATDDEGQRQMWNRAHLKVCRLSALLAVADNHIQPIVSTEHVDWALTVVKNDISIMQRKIEHGEVGTGDYAREKKLLAILKDYVDLDSKISNGYRISDVMRMNGVFPRRYLQVKCARVSSFYQAKQGPVKAMDEAIKGLIDNGYIAEMDRKELREKYNLFGKCYRILDLPDCE